MAADHSKNREERILVLAPTGRDAEVIRDALAEGSITAEICASVEGLCAALEEGAGAILLAEEAITAEAVEKLSAVLRAQPPWSDVPILIATGYGETTAARVRAVRALEPAGNITVLERPGRVFTLIVAIQAALRARQRQYEMRRLLREQQAQLEELKTERELRARFVSLLAHDLRGPLNAARLASQVLLHEPEQLDKRRNMAARIERNLGRIDQMVRNLLDVSRIQAGHPLPLRLEECDLLQIATQVADELNGMHGERISVVGRGELRGIWSAAELTRAIWNLAANAIKYGASEGPVTIRLEREDGRATVSVHNQGAPLSPEDQQRIFEPFARARSVEGTGTTGWGLGLTLVRGCAEAHGGTVRVSSDAQAGTTFTIELPLDARPFQPQFQNSGLPQRPDRSGVRESL